MHKCINAPALALFYALCSSFFVFSLGIPILFATFVPDMYITQANIPMKKLVLFTLLLVAVMPLMAQQRSDAEMEAIARQQFMSGKAKGMKALSATSLKRVHSDQAYAVYSPSNAEGFVVVSRDNRMQPVLGYSAGTFDAATVPCNMKWWLGEVDRAYNRLQKKAPGDAPGPEPPIGPDGIEVPFPMKWSQASPYNTKVPVDQAPTGCVAVAMSEIMNYHQWPQSAQFMGAYRYPEEFDEDLNPVYDEYGEPIWHQIQGIPVNSTYTWPLNFAYDFYVDEEGEYHNVETSPEEEALVAQLMRDCGLAVNMGYVAGGGSDVFASADPRDIASALPSCFGYADQPIRYHDRYYFTPDEWRSIIVDELRKGCPVMYGGSDRFYSNAHVFIVYGMDADGFMHINWGWTGLYDGYYHVDDLVIYNDDDKQEVIEDYRYYHLMITGIRKTAFDGERYTSELCMDGMAAEDLTYDRNTQPHFQTLATNIVNDQPVDFVGDIYIAVEEDGQETQYSRIPFTSDFIVRSGYYYPEQPLKSDLLLENGHSYRIFFAARDKKEEDYTPIRCYSGQWYYKVSVDENGIGTFEGPYLFEGHTPTGVKGLKADKSDVNDGITRVYDLQGRTLYSAPAAAFNLKDVPGRGVVIVRNGDKTKKIIR